MRKLMVMVGCAALGLSGAAWAQGKQVREALDLVRDAIERVDDEGGRCRKAVLRDLEDLKGELKALKETATEKSLRRAARDLRDLARDAREACPKKIHRLLEDALEELERAAERVGREDDDHDRPLAPPCWEAGDPGCGRTRGGVLPMDRAAFDSLLGVVRGAKPQVFQMLDMFKASLGEQRLTCRQLGRVVQELKPHVFQMLDAVKAAAPNLVDPDHAGEVTPIFQPHTFQMQDAAQIIGSQRAD